MSTKKLILLSLFLVCFLSSFCEGAIFRRVYRQSSVERSYSRETVQVCSEEEEFRCLQLVNEERIRRKMQPLKFAEDLANASRQWSENMRSRGFRHGAGREIIARGGPTGDFAFRIWMNSGPHRGALLNPSYREVGFGASGSFWTGRFR